MASVLNKVRFHLMRRIQNKFLRDSITNSIVKKIGRTPYLKGTSLFVKDMDQEQKSLADTFLQDGIVYMPENLSDQKIKDIKEYAEGLNCHDPYRKELGRFNRINAPDEARLASYFRDDLVKCDTIMKIANDPALLNIVQDYLGAKPTISSIDMWWSIPRGGEAQDAQIFHRDVSDYKFCKLFIYLTDVDEESGPHLYIKKTVNRPEFRKVKRYSDEEIYDKFGKSNVLEIIAPKGTTFLEDTYGFHKGVPPASKLRLLFQVQYSLNPIFGYTYNPVDLGANHGYDKYINRLFVK